jgi:hypothetical protein
VLPDDVEYRLPVANFIEIRGINSEFHVGALPLPAPVSCCFMPVPAAPEMRASGNSSRAFAVLSTAYFQFVN